MVGYVVRPAAGVRLRDAVVATGGGEVAGAVADPGELRGREVPGVREGFTVRLVGVGRGPGAVSISKRWYKGWWWDLLDLVGRVRDPVHHAVDLTSLLVDIRLQPIIPRIRLNPPQKLQSPIPSDEVHQRRHRISMRAPHARDDPAQDVESVARDTGHGPGRV